MKNIAFSLVCLFSIQLIMGQVNYVNDEGGAYQTGTIDSPFLRVSQSSDNKIVGSIYLNDELEQAVITDGASNKTKFLARFNAYSSEIEILQQGNTKALLPVVGLKVSLHNKTFAPLKLKDNPKTIFAEVLVDGDYSLYKKYSIKINRAPSDAKLLNLENTDKAVIVSNLYEKNKEGELTEIFLGRKAKVTLSKELLNLSKKNKLSLKKEKDLITLFKLANTQY